jgi:lysozyme
VLVGVFGQVPEGWIRVPVADMVRGIDVSHHQGNIDWALVAQSDVGFAYAKATEGATWQDDHFANNWADAASNGIPRGAYHLLREPSSSSAADQAQNFTDTVTLEPGDLPPAIDVETARLEQIIAELGVANAWEHIWNWCEAVETGTGFRPLLYMSKRGIDALHGNVGSLPALELWMPRYRNINNLPPLPQDTAGNLIFPHWSVWQHSETGNIPGIAGQNVDLNVFNGNQQHFAQWIQTVQP